jgi:ribose 5-phosphate isomerase A
MTDEGNYILDLHLKRIGNPRQLALVLNQIPGVVENGLFIDICDIVVIGAMATGGSRCATSTRARIEDATGGFTQSREHLRQISLRIDLWRLPTAGAGA